MKVVEMIVSPPYEQWIGLTPIPLCRALSAHRPNSILQDIIVYYMLLYDITVYYLIL